MSSPRRSQPIGLFDSGLGGLTVLKALHRSLPQEALVYFGDTARLPYGNKSRETIIKYAKENASFLMKYDIKMLVIACNTASAYALEILQETLPIPVIGVVGPGAHKAATISSRGKIAVLGTRATILSKTYERALIKELPHAEIYSIACPLFVPLIEENFIEHPSTRLIVHEYLSPLKHKSIDTLLLGCTHYPLLKAIIREEIGADIKLVDSANTCAETVEEELIKRGLMRLPGTIRQEDRFFVSDDPYNFQSLGERFLGCKLPLCQNINEAFAEEFIFN